jgi:outer membrane protein TolC
MRYATSDRLRRRGASWVGISLALGGLLSAGAARAEVIPLAVLEQTALETRSALAAQKAKARAAEARVRLARSTGPSLALTAQGALSPGSQPVRVIDVHGNEYLVPGSRAIGQEGAFVPTPQYGLGLTLQGRLYDFGRTRATVRAAGVGLDATHAETEAERARILHEVRAAYLGWVVAHAATAIARQSSENARKHRELVEAAVEDGSRPASDLPAVRADEARARLRLIEARGRETSARTALEAAVEQPLPPAAEPDPAMLDMAPPSGGPARSAELVALERRRDAAFAQARSFERPSLPTLDATAEAGPRGQGARIFPAYRVGVLLSIPLWDDGSHDAQRAIASAEASELSARADELARALSRERAQALADLRNAEERLRAADALRLALEDSVRLAEERYELGGAGTLETILQARAAMADALLEVLQARAARADAVLRLRELPSGSGARR